MPYSDFWHWQCDCSECSRHHCQSVTTLQSTVRPRSVTITDHVHVTNVRADFEPRPISSETLLHTTSTTYKYNTVLYTTLHYSLATGWVQPYLHRPDGPRSHTCIANGQHNPDDDNAHKWIKCMFSNFTTLQQNIYPHLAKFTDLVTREVATLPTAAIF